MDDIACLRGAKTTIKLEKKIPELIELERIISKVDAFGKVRIENVIEYDGIKFPIYSLGFGVDKPNAPVIVFIAGVHGLERIGTSIIIEYLKTFKELLFWDRVLDYVLSECRILFYPMVNPVGIYRRSRSNGNGVDLMRNAPIESPYAKKYGVIAGHRISKRLPWFRGYSEMEVESKTLCNFLEREIFAADFALSLDIHSGFGQVDRLWFPYAGSKNSYTNYIEMYALKRKIDQALPNHIYKIEPQSHQYLTHGDIWDYIDAKFIANNSDTKFLPLTLEMGSWQWVKKNPKQLLSSLGPFHPVLPHRTQRIMRRHLNLMDFLIRATVSHKKWSRPPAEKKRVYANDAMSLWYPKT